MSSSGSVRLRYEICLQVWGNASAGYFDDVTTVIQGGSSSVKALTGSTEEEQFH